MKQDGTEAEKWLLRSAEQDNLLATYTLSRLYDEGELLPGDEAKAVEFLFWAAEDGWPPAENRLGLRLLSGKGVEHDPEQDKSEALRWFKMAGKQGIIDFDEVVAELDTEQASRNLLGVTSASGEASGRWPGR